MLTQMAQVMTMMMQTQTAIVAALAQIVTNNEAKKDATAAARRKP
jgi:hypothetical protein